MKYALLLITLLLSSCTTYHYAKLTDQSPQNWKKERKIQVSGVRGFTLVSFTASDFRRENFQFAKSQGYYSKRRIIKMWGQPDKVEYNGGIDYLSFFQEKYPMQSSPPGPCVLGFRGDELVYIQTWRASHDKNIKPEIIE
jgi:hypothetical protein